jgi:hypothetical protein
MDPFSLLTGGVKFDKRRFNKEVATFHQKGNFQQEQQQQQQQQSHGPVVLLPPPVGATQAHRKGKAHVRQDSGKILRRALT